MITNLDVNKPCLIRIQETIDGRKRLVWRNYKLRIFDVTEVGELTLIDDQGRMIKTHAENVKVIDAK